MSEKLNEVKARIETLQSKVSEGFDSASRKVESEGRKILNGLGAELDSEENSPAEVIKRLRAHNPDLKTLFRNLDTATYDLRGRLNWDLAMLGAFTRMKVEKTYNQDIQPLVEKYSKELRSRFNKQNEAA